MKELIVKLATVVVFLGCAAAACGIVNCGYLDDTKAAPCPYDSYRGSCYAPTSFGGALHDAGDAAP